MVVVVANVDASDADVVANGDDDVIVLEGLFEIVAVVVWRVEGLAAPEL